MMKRLPQLTAGLLLIGLAACGKESPPSATSLASIKLPPGFKINLYANVPNARGMVLGDKGTLFVGSMKAGNVYAIKDGKVLIIAKGLQLPVGVAFKDGSLYVSAVDRILRFDDIEQQLQNPPKPVIVNDTFPTETHHGWKFIAFGPDGWLYVPVGAPCNVCVSTDPRFGTIMRMKADGSDPEIFAEGVRNSVGFDWDPKTKDLWFTDNGADLMGNNFPPDELNHAPRKGMDFGFPHCHGNSVADPEYGKGLNCAAYTPSTVQLGPHVAPLGMRFYTGKMFPESYHGKIFIAEHGSWNRDTPIGYRITVVDPLHPKQSYDIFAEGWLQGSKAWGRPVDVLVMPDGSMLVSDDTGNAIYRITYQK